MENRKKRREVEILAPAGTYEAFEAAIRSGADAVYAGGNLFGARAYAGNFDEETMIRAIREAHLYGRKLYLTVNTLIKEREMKERLFSFLKPFYENGLDAVLVQDLGALAFIREQFPDLAIHASTQMSVAGALGAGFLKQYGVERVVPARELSLAEIRKMKEETGLEIECFVQGALCYSYSGQCLFSSMLGGRSGNRGQCAQPCRLKYQAEGQKKPSCILSLKDIMALEDLPDLIEAGVDSFKIEGRMKTALYVATVARTYRRALDDYRQDPKLYEKNMPWYLDQISNCTYRQFTTGFFFGKPDENTQIYDSNTYVKEYTYLGIVGEVKDGLCRIEQRNKFSVGETIEIMKPDGSDIEVVVRRILNEEGEEQESAPHSKRVLYIDLEGKAEKYDILRRAERKE